jgi:hypothetical protein
MNLTDEQSLILSAIGRSFRIIAGAGSGKTTTLTLFVKALLDANMATPSQIAFITFTRLASQDIKRKVRALIPGAQICCGTFHAVMFGFMRKAGIPLPDPVNLYDGCMERNIAFVLQQMQEHPRLATLLQTFRVLVVDEFQDLDPHQFAFIRLFRRIQPTLQVIAIGDLAQNIYRFRGTSNEFLRRLLQEEIVPELGTFYLRTNFRSSPAILQAVNTVFAEEIRNGHVLPMIPPVSASAEGPKPKYYEAQKLDCMGDYENMVVDTIVPVIRRAKESRKSVVLIFPILKCQSYETILALVSSRLDVDFHRIAKEDATSALVEITYDAREPGAPVQLSSFHASKGLEWDTVILVNVSDDVYRLRENEIDDEGFYTERTNLLYVGMTRPREELLIFCHGTRHRLLARIPNLGEVMDITLWGKSVPRPSGVGPAKPTSVAKLVKAAALHPDLFARMVACSEHIRSSFHRGEPLHGDAIYSQMKQRNREAEFGTFMDWMIKRSISTTPTLQCRLLEILSFMSQNNFFHRDNAKASHEVLNAVVTDFFERAGGLPNTDPSAYYMPIRFIAEAKARRIWMVPELSYLYAVAEKRIMSVFKKTEQDLRDMYVLSHTLSLYARGELNAIRAVDAPANTYMGLPDGFDEFAAASVAPAAAIVREAVGSDTLCADIPVETQDMLYGEMDLMTTGGDCIVEIKCSAELTSAGLRGTANCVHLLQLLAYVAIGRHGVLQLQPRSAVLVNPLTATWERYDLSTWLPAQSQEFLACLEELRMRS